MKNELTKLIACASLVAISIFLCGCGNKTKPTSVIEVYMAPLKVGVKTAYYEVISPSELKLSEGVKIKPLKDANGKDNGFVLLLDNGGLGGFMSCECSGATKGNCVTENDNPANPSCSGGCVDSEGKPGGCAIAGPIIGPPQDPAVRVRVFDIKDYDRSMFEKYIIK